MMTAAEMVNLSLRIEYTVDEYSHRVARRQQTFVSNDLDAQKYNYDLSKEVASPAELQI